MNSNGTYYYVAYCTNQHCDPPGSTSSGPAITISPVPLSVQEHISSSLKEITDDDYLYLQNISFNIDTTSGTYKAELAEVNRLFADSAYVANITQVEDQKWINPEKVPAYVSKHFATQHGLTIYGLTLKSNPVTSSVNFDLWSAKGQQIDFMINNINTGQTLYLTSVNLNEGKNENIMVNTPSSITNGDYIMVLKTSINQIKTKIVVLNK